MPDPNRADLVTVDGKQLVVPSSDGKTFAVARPTNRADRRRAARAMGDRGKKAKRIPQNLPRRVSEEEKAMQEINEANEKVFESARNIRQATSGRFWLPGQQ